MAKTINNKLTPFQRAQRESSFYERTTRRSIGLYSKLRVTLAVINPKHDKNVSMLLTKGKYTFSKKQTKVNGIYVYSVAVASIEKAYALKLKIKKIK